MQQFDHQSYASDDLLPPPPLPPKMQFNSRGPSPDLPPTPIDYFSPSQRSSPSRSSHKLAPLSPPINGSSTDHLTPSTPNHFIDLPASSTNSSLKTKQSKKVNPLTDLVDSEREYVELLASIIRKVAGAWSRTNFPPKQLDAMFRAVESVYKANRGLLTKLKEIGPTPTSPKALGDLLMRWIDDLDAPYTKYCANYAIGFDVWQPIADNDRLPPILAALSKLHIPPSSLSADSGPSSPPTWTLDSLFALPRARLKYYKKLYSRLLKSTQPGRSDHKLLTGAVEKLESLLMTLSEKEMLLIGQQQDENGMSAKVPSVSEQQTHPPTESLDVTNTDRSDKVLSNITGSETTDDQARGSVGSSVPPSSVSSGARASQETPLSKHTSRVTSSATMSMPISNLESRLSTGRVLDIFTLKPRAVRLQMNPPSLPFTRTFRLSYHVEIYFTPRATPDSPRIHSRGHIFLLTDLFLVCERMTAVERDEANSTAEGRDYDMWLLYPPLAGKHLRVSECPDQDNVLQVQILKKEMLFLHVETKADRDFLIKEFKECIESATLLSPHPGQPLPPPVPPLKIGPPSPSDLQLQSQERDQLTSSRPTSLSAASATNPNTQPWDQRLPADPPAALAQSQISSRVEMRSPPLSPEGGALLPHSNDGRGLVGDGGPRMPYQSTSQPHFHSPVASGSSHQFQQPLSPISQSASTPFIPPPRGTSAMQRGEGQVGHPTRPSTAPGQRQYGSPPPLQLNNYPGQYLPPQIHTANSFQSHSSFPSEQSTRAGNFSSGPPNLMLHKSPSAVSLGSTYIPNRGQPLPAIPGQPAASNGPHARDSSVNYASVSHVYQPHARMPFPPPGSFTQRTASFATTDSWTPSREPSPPISPTDDEPVPSGPVTSSIIAQFKCKVFLKVQHGQWKALGGGRLKLYLQQPTNVKQLVVESDTKDKTMLISTIVLTDGVERVGKTGVAIELSDQGARTGIIYMIQLRNEASASGLFDSLLAGSDRAAASRR